MWRLFFIILLLSVSSQATDFKLKSRSGQIDIWALNSELPEEQLKKELDSGLSTIIFATLKVFKNGKVISNSNLEYKVHYDLWGEVYHLQINNGESDLTEIIVSKSLVINKLKNHIFKSALRADQVGSSPIELVFAMAIDPISKDKRLKIRKWLAENQVGMTSSDAASEGGARPSTNLSSELPMTGNLFNRILQDELGDKMDSAKWAYATPKKIIYLKDVISEK